MIEQYFSIKENDNQTYDFQFICITEDCDQDDMLINELQKAGDFGEIFASLIINFIENKETFNKLRWKYNNDKSVFGTDIVSFDSLDEPSEICYCEVKTRENCLKKEEVSRGKNGNDVIIEKDN